MNETLEEMLNAEPFHPFRIRLTNGADYDVRDPLSIAVGQSEISIYYPKSDRKAYLRKNQIAAIETIEPSKGAA